MKAVGVATNYDRFLICMYIEEHFDLNSFLFTWGNAYYLLYDEHFECDALKITEKKGKKRTFYAYMDEWGMVQVSDCFEEVDVLPRPNEKNYNAWLFAEDLPFRAKCGKEFT